MLPSFVVKRGLWCLYCLCNNNAVAVYKHSYFSKVVQLVTEQDASRPGDENENREWNENDIMRIYMIWVLEYMIIRKIYPHNGNIGVVWVSLK